MSLIFSSLLLVRRFLEFDRVLVVADEHVEVMAENRGGLEQGVVGRDAAVGPDFEDQAVVIGALADAGVFDGVTHAGHGREEGVDRNDADGLIGFLVLVARRETAADFDFQFHLEFLLLVERADVLVGIDQFVILDELDVGGGHFAFLVHGERELARFVIGRLEFHLLQVQHDVGHILDHAGKVANSCCAPSILMEVMAAPSSEERSTRRSELPTVWP